MERKNILIIGAGAHAKVILEAILLQDEYHVMGFCVDTMAIGDTVFADYSVIADARLTNLPHTPSMYFVVAIGDNAARKEFYNSAQLKFTPATIVHPRSYVSAKALVGTGSVILAGAILNASSSIGVNTIVNLGVIVDHDSSIGDHAHLSPGTIVGSYASIADQTTTSIGQIIVSSK